MYICMCVYIYIYIYMYTYSTSHFWLQCPYLLSRFPRMHPFAMPSPAFVNVCPYASRSLLYKALGALVPVPNLPGTYYIGY